MATESTTINLGIESKVKEKSLSPSRKRALEHSVPTSKKLKLSETKQYDTKFKNIASLVEAIGGVLNEGPANTPQKRKTLQKILENYDASGEDWKRYEFWCDSKKYTRNLIANEEGKFTLLLLCWNKGKASPIHDHPCDGCWMRVVDGDIREEQFANEKSKLTVVNEKGESEKVEEFVCTKDVTHKAGVVGFINDEIALHRVGNPSKEHGAVTLHLYSPPVKRCSFWCGVRAKKQSCTMTMFSEYGELVKYD
eukprot:g3125.t1